MTTSDGTSAFRVIHIDDTLRAEHSCLTAEDACYCLGEYHSRGGYAASPVNNLISNFKKSVELRGTAQYIHKVRAITKVAQLVGKAFNPDAATSLTFVPIPPSKSKDDPLHDDRLVQALKQVTPQLDVREMLLAPNSMRAHHEYAQGEKRPSAQELYGQLIFDPQCLAPAPAKTLVLFDDVLTNGAHFKACKQLLLENLPEHQVVGLFIGRTKRAPAADLDLASLLNM